jgi:hypothetical protein
MLKLWKGMLAAAVLAAHPALTQAEEAKKEAIPAPAATLTCAPVIDSNGHHNNGQCRRGFIFDFEATFMRFHREGGVADVAGGEAEFDLDFTPRLEVGYVLDNGLGVRGRAWRYDASATSSNDLDINVESTVIDLEAFKAVNLGCATIEISGGVRLLDFEHQLEVPGTTFTSDFEAWGLTVGLTGRYQAFGGAFYAKGRWSVVMEDIDLIIASGGATSTFTARDHSASQIEVGIGYERAFCLRNGAVLRIRAGLEFQQWTSMVVTTPAPNTFGAFDRTQDVGFGGVVLGVGLDW